MKVLPKAVPIFPIRDHSELSPELVPAFARGSSLPQLEQAAVVLSDDLLSDMLFGDVIDISELIPQLLTPSGETAGLNSTGPTAPPIIASTDSDDVLAGPGLATLTILYDDDILAPGGSIL
jgi:hypothetical protein